MLLALYKPYGVLSQFTSDGSKHLPLSTLGLPKHVYPLGRLDADSEGLLLLSDEKGLNDRLMHPRAQHPRTYWAQVERVPHDDDLQPLRQGGVALKTHTTLPAEVVRLDDDAVDLPPRDPPIRHRQSVATCWLQLTLTEGKNRQVRRMTAHVGFPTLRLVRVAIGDLRLHDLLQVGLDVGSHVELDDEQRQQVFAGAAPPPPPTRSGRGRRSRRR